jgi:hypothetical protein
MARPPLVLIRGGASRLASEKPLEPVRLTDDSVPYSQLVELARRRAFYSALTTEVFDSTVARSCDPRFRRRRR